MTLDKCIVLRIGTLTGCTLCRESHPLCRLKNPTVISIWLLVGFHPASRSVQSTPADNTRKRVWQYIEKESTHSASHYYFRGCKISTTQKNLYTEKLIKYAHSSYSSSVLPKDDLFKNIFPYLLESDGVLKNMTGTEWNGTTTK